MSTIDVAVLAAEISPEAPAGASLEYDPAFGELERAVQGRPAQEMGSTVVPAVEADWKDVKNRAIEILKRSKDLRAAMYLTRALVRTDGLPGFADGITLLNELMIRHWATMHPQLDPDDGNDPTMRVNILTTLVDPDATIRLVKLAPLVRSRTIGQFSLRDIEIAKGEIPPPPRGENDPPPAEMPVIEAAFLESDLEELKNTADGAVRALDAFTALDKQLLQTVGTMHAPDLAALPPVLQRAKQVLAEQLQRRGINDPALGVEGAAEGGGAPQAITGEITSRDDVLRALDRIVDYFNRHEPSSPVPLLLKRAKRLVSKNFLEILQDLAPSGVADAEKIRGPEQ